jgi:hypothetical protein
MAGGFGLSTLRYTFRANSIRRGLLGGSRFWLAMFALGRLARLSGRISKRGTMPIRYSEELRPGERLVIEHLDVPRGRSA